jgi:protein-S-isoprenylcysteine O-methyltransferase Ste14
MDGMSICGCVWIAWIMIWMIWAFQSKKTQKRESLPSRLSYTIIAWAAGTLLFSPRGLGNWGHATIVPYHAWMDWLAVAITALGFALTLWARAILGGNWSSSVTIKVTHELIRSGPYRWVRHPIYTGLIVAMAGTSIARDQWRGVVAVFLLWIAFTVKRLKEEQFMRQTFGPQYAEYAQTTGAIFPRLLTNAPS